MKAPRQTPRRLAIIVSHPIQYYAPWFRQLAQTMTDQIRVFYLWDFGVRPQRDPDFECEFAWDVDLLGGYESVFVPNVAHDAGPHRFFGLRNPQLVSRVAAWNPDAIMLFGYRSWSHVRLIFSHRLRRVPFVFRGDSHLLTENGSALRRLVKLRTLGWIFRRFQACLWVGRANHDYFSEIGVSESVLFWAPHAVDEERFRPVAHEGVKRNRFRRKWDIPENHRVLLFAGKLEKKKRPDDLVAAFISAHLENVTLVIVGSGPLEESLRRMAGDHPCIRFVPFQNQSQMPAVYAAADLFCLPSQGPGESWGMAVQEALSCGIPAIVSDEVGCQSDLIRPGWNGLVFPAGDRAALTRALAHAFSDRERLQWWSRNGRWLVEAFTYPRATAGLQQALSSVAAEKT